MTQQEKQQFEYWLTNNMYINKATAELIIQHCEQYFGTFKSPSMASNEDRWIPIGEGLPTIEDGDKYGYVLVWDSERERPHVISFDFVCRNIDVYTHWRKLPSPPVD